MIAVSVAVPGSGLGAMVASAPGTVVAVASASLVVSGCNKSEKKEIPKEESKATPVPSDMVFNDFLPQTGNASGLAVRVDGGVLEAGAPGSPGEAPGDESAASKPKLLEAGAEPRAARHYAFTAGRTDRRVVVIRQSASADGKSMDQPPLAITVDFTPKGSNPTRFEMKLVKIDLADKEKLDPRMVQAAAQQLGMFSGLVASFDVSAHGDVGELSLSGSEKMQQEGAEMILDAFQQIAEIAFVPLPEEPIGVGAKWERDEAAGQGAGKSGETSKRSFELKEVSPQGGTIASTVERTVAKRPYPDPRLRGATVEVHAQGSYTYAISFDHVPTKVTGEQIQKVTIEVPNPNGNGEKKTIHQDVKISHTLQAPGK